MTDLEWGRVAYEATTCFGLHDRPQQQQAPGALLQTVIRDDARVEARGEVMTAQRLVPSADHIRTAARETAQAWANRVVNQGDLGPGSGGDAGIVPVSSGHQRQRGRQRSPRLL